MIQRIWHGWTAAGEADAYQHLLAGTIVPGIVERGIDGLVDTAILRAREPDDDGAVEFVTVMTFEHWGAVEAFAGGDGSESVVPAPARALLARFDHRSRHYHLVSRQGRAHPAAA